MERDGCLFWSGTFIVFTGSAAILASHSATADPTDFARERDGHVPNIRHHPTRGYNEGRIVDEISRDHGVRREIVRADVTEFIASEILAMPGNDGLGLENGRRRLPIVPPPGEPDSEDTIRPAEAKLVATARTPQHQKLMAEGKNLCLQNKARSETISETGEKSQHFFGKVTHQGFQNAMISTRTEFW